MSKADVLASLLDVNSKLTVSVFPEDGTVEVYEVADTTARDALTVQAGDVAVVTGGDSFVYDGSAWVKLILGKSTVDALGVDAATVGGEAPSAFADATHTHTLTDVTDAGTAAASATTDFATAAQGALADSSVQYADDFSQGVINKIVKLTQAQYDAIGTKDSTVFYVIV
jgi:precorrin-2 methylase